MAVPPPRSPALLLGLVASCVGGSGDETAAPPTASGPQYAAPPPGAEPGPAAGPIAAALASVPPAVGGNYTFALSADRNELTIDPRRREATRAMRDRSGFEARDSANGGKIVTLAGGPFRDGRWLRASFREQVRGDAQLEQLRRAGYDVAQVRDLLVVQGEHDGGPTVFAFSADASKPGLVGICSQVTIVDFVPGSTRPVAVRKPVIYLYPEAETRVRVKVEIDGAFVAVYPAMAAAGWDVTAAPDGALVDRATGRKHRYLFWEGTSVGFAIDPARAFCVAAADTAAFLERACGRFGLTDHECGDFVTYWLPALERNAYNVIQFVDEDVYEQYARLTVEPRPDTVIRQFMIFRGSDAPVVVGSPALPQRTRRGFTVVEWGGADVGAAQLR